MEKRKISRRKSGKGGREGSARNFSKIIEMSRSNFSNCKNPDAVVQCAVRIDRASPEGGEGQACCTCRLHEEGEREGRGSGESAGAVMARTLTLRRSHGRAGRGEARSRSQSGANPIHKSLSLSSPLSLPQRTAIQRANDSLTRDIFGWQIRWEAEAEPDSVLAITSTITTHGAAGRRS